MKIRNPEFKTCVEQMFKEAAFISQLGIKLKSVEPGMCEAMLDIVPEHRQHLGRIHGGVLATLAGHTAGGAATTILPAGMVVVGVEFNVNLLRAIDGNQLLCRAHVLKPGTKLIVAESEVYDGAYKAAKLVTKATFTFIAVKE